MASQTGAMFDEFSVVGGIEEGEVTVKSARFNQWDYNGTVPVPVLALRTIMLDTEGAEHNEQLSSGDLKYFIPSEDGKRAIPVGTQTKLNASTNAAAFIISLINADTRGEMAGKLRTTDDISVIDGIRLYVKRKEVKRSGIIQTQPGPQGVVGGTRQQTQLIVDKVIAYPWEAQAAGKQQSAPAGATQAGPATPAPAGNGAAHEAATSILLQVVAEAGGAIKKTAIAGKVFSNADAKAMTAPERNALLGMIVRDDFLASEQVASMGITFDKAAGTLTLG